MAAGSLIPLSEISIEKNQLDKAKEYLDSAYRYIHISHKTDRLRLLYPALCKWHIKKSNEKLAIAYMDSATKASKQYEQKFNTLKLLRVQQKIADQQIEITTAKLKTERYRRQLFLSLLITTLIVFIISTVYYRRIQKLKMQRKELQLKQTKNQLDDARMNLEQFMKSVFEKNEIIDKLNEQLTEKNKTITADQLQRITILTPEDWDTFQRFFDQVFPDYRFSLKQKHPSLTAAELRYLLLEKLQLTTKEMATMLGVSPNAVQVTRHRLHKKHINHS